VTEIPLDALRQVLEKQGDERGAALLFAQRLVLASSGKWEPALEALRSIDADEAREALFRSFCDLQVRMAGVRFAGPLLEALWCGEDHPAAFLADLRIRITEETIARPREAADREMARLLLATGGREIAGRQPRLVKWLANLASRADPPLEASIREALRRVGCEVLLPELIAHFGRRLPGLVPEPDRVGGSDYRSCAEALAALRELAPEAASAILERWRGQHHRRPNLWKALRSAGIE
jgi:hypothetical protein